MVVVNKQKQLLNATTTTKSKESNMMKTKERKKQLQPYTKSERMVKKLQLQSKGRMKGNIDSQIEYLFRDYLLQKQAYKEAIKEQ